MLLGKFLSLDVSLTENGPQGISKKPAISGEKRVNIQTNKQILCSIMIIMIACRPS